MSQGLVTVSYYRRHRFIYIGAGGPQQSGAFKKGHPVRHDRDDLCRVGDDPQRSGGFLRTSNYCHGDWWRHWT